MKNTRHICADCGGPVCGYSHRCERCKHKHNNEIARRVMASCRARNKKIDTSRREAPQKRKGGARAGGNNVQHLLTLTIDPRPVNDGGFRPGAQFFLSDVRMMLDCRNDAPLILDGTMFRNYEKNIGYVVNDGKLQVTA